MNFSNNVRYLLLPNYRQSKRDIKNSVQFINGPRTRSSGELFWAISFRGLRMNFSLISLFCLGVTSPEC